MLILVQTVAALRFVAYEMFLLLHILLVAATIAGAYIHCRAGGLVQLLIVKCTILIWLVEVSRF